MRLLLTCLLLILSSILRAQELTVVKGKIIDLKTNEVITGAMMVFAGTEDRCVSSFEGTFTAKTRSNSDTLIVSYVGYETQNIKVSQGITQVVQIKMNAKVAARLIKHSIGRQNQISIPLSERRKKLQSGNDDEVTSRRRERRERLENRNTTAGEAPDTTVEMHDHEGASAEDKVKAGPGKSRAQRREKAAAAVRFFVCFFDMHACASRPLGARRDRLCCGGG